MYNEMKPRRLLTTSLFPHWEDEKGPGYGPKVAILGIKIHVE